jgi:glycosyltransferase involved in cell wall biosynthesis
VNPVGFSLGGVTTWSVEMARQLQARKRPTLLINHPCHKLPEVIAPGADTGRVVQAHRLGVLRGTRSNVAIYRSALPATFVPNWSPEAYALCARLSRTHAADMRVIGYCHADQGFYYRLLRYFEPIIHRFVAVSPECGQVLGALLPHRMADILVRPYAVREPQGWRRPPHPENAPLRLLYAGRIVQEQKKVFDLPPLARELARRRVDFHLRVVGDGADAPALRARFAALPPEARERVSVEPAVSPDRIPEFLRDADVCLLTSAYEGTSIFMLEGMAHGCVPVVTAVNGSGVIDPGLSGFTTPVGDVRAQADAVATLAGDRRRLGQMSRRAASRAREHGYRAYADWFIALTDSAWQAPPRQWLPHRPYLPWLEVFMRSAVRVFPPLRPFGRWLGRHLFQGRPGRLI